MQRYEAMVFELYTEPKEEIIVGKYLQTDVDITIQYPELQPKKKKKVAKKDAPLPPSYGHFSKKEPTTTSTIMAVVKIVEVMKMKQ